MSIDIEITQHHIDCAAEALNLTTRNLLARGERQDLNGLSLVAVLQLLLINRTTAEHGAGADDHKAHLEWDIARIRSLFENEELWNRLSTVIGEDRGEVKDGLAKVDPRLN